MGAVWLAKMMPLGRGRVEYAGYSFVRPAR